MSDLSRRQLMELLTEKEQCQVKMIKALYIAMHKTAVKEYGETIALKALRDATQQAIGRSVAEKVNRSLK
jgi:hypothetical protein